MKALFPSVYVFDVIFNISIHLQNENMYISGSMQHYIKVIVRQTNQPPFPSKTNSDPPWFAVMKYHLGSPRIGCRHNIVIFTIFLSNMQHLIFYQCINVPPLHLLVAPETTLS